MLQSGLTFDEVNQSQGRTEEGSVVSNISERSLLVYDENARAESYARSWSDASESEAKTRPRADYTGQSRRVVVGGHGPPERTAKALRPVSH